MFSKDKWQFFLRLDQIGVALIPAVIGILAMLNDSMMFKGTVNSVVEPLITMAANSSGQTWRALPMSVSNIAYTVMFCGEFLVGILAVIGIVLMIKNINKPVEKFEAAKRWVYLACGWGIIVWGLGFFEIGGDWFLAWMSSNGNVSSLQAGSLNYVLEVFVAFVYLKLIRQ